METVSRGERSPASAELCKATAPNHNHETNEVEPLLNDQHRTISYGGDKPQDEAPRPESLRHILWDEVREMVQLAIPVIGTYILEMLPGIVSIILVGHVHGEFTKEYMDAASLAVMFVNLTALSVGFGLASAMDTLCSQAVGANEEHRIGNYLQTGFIVLSAAFCVVFLLNYYASRILQVLGQPTLISELAGTFTLWLIPGIPFLFLYELLRKVLQAQHVAMPMLYIAIAANLINAVLGWYLVYYTQWGWLGASVARTVCNVSFCLFMVLYLWASNSFQSFWGGWHLAAALKGLPEFFSLGIPGALQLCFEYWAFECLALISGLLPNAVLAIGANAILLNISSMVFMLYLGVSIAGNVRIGYALGAGLPKRAALAANLTIGLALGCSVLCAVFLLSFRTSLPYLFTHDKQINAYTSELLYVAAAFQVADAMNGAIQGIFRGSGRQHLGAWLNFAAYYVLGIPVSVLLAFHYGQSVMGLWIGMSVGLYAVGIVGGFLVERSDWSALSDDARSRLEESQL